MNIEGLGSALVLGWVLVGCGPDAEIVAPERMAVGSEISIEVNTTIALTATECTDQLDCENGTGVVESVRFEPEGMVELAWDLELPASDPAIQIRGLKTGVVTMIAEGDFGTEEVEIEIVAPASARVVGHEKILLSPGGIVLPGVQLYDGEGDVLAGTMPALESDDPAIAVSEWNEVSATGPLGEFVLRDRLGGGEAMRVRVQEDTTADSIEGAVYEAEGWDADTRFVGVELFQDGYFLPNAAEEVRATVIEEGEGTCQLAFERFMSNEQVRLTLWNPGTCKITLETAAGVKSELHYEVK